jgi:SNW domain-containing protein 1
MGKPGAKSMAVISVNVNDKGEVVYDALVKQGANKNKIVHTSIEDVKEKTEVNKDKIAIPDEKEEQETAERTKLALESILEGKIKSSKPSTVNHAPESNEPTYIRYTPNPDAPG